MGELISISVSIISIFCIGVIVARKIPALADLPENLQGKEETIGLKLKLKIKEWPSVKNFSYELFLRKFISKIRILSLKTENQTFNWLQKLKERSKSKISFPSSSACWQTQETKNKKLEEDGYWEEIKKNKEKK